MNNDTFSEEDSVAFEEPLMSQVIQQEALTRLLVEKGIFIKEECLYMSRRVESREEEKKMI